MTTLLLVATTTALLLASPDRIPGSGRRGPVSPKPVPNGPAIPVVADSVVIDKSGHMLVLYQHGAPIRIYFVALGRNPVGDKQREGDNRTPEGVFHIQNHNPDSKYHLALRISYPDEQHAARARALGVEPGGDIMIHGLPKGFEDAGALHRVEDWTNGCIAVTNEEIEEIWREVPDGTPVLIKP